MKYFEISNTVYLKKDISSLGIHNNLSRLINYSMKKREYLKSLHAEKNIKMYCFDYLYPREEDRIYKKGRVYVFRLRTPIKKIAEEMSRAISITENDDIKVLGSNMMVKRYTPRLQLYTATPIICTLGKKNWTIEDGMDLLEEKIEKNLVSKYRLFYEEEPEKTSDFISYIEKKNKKNLVLDYKDGKLLGNKIQLEFNTDDTSVKMSYLSYTTGLLEKSSSLGTGFCI
ncbi:MAG: hypothetical protein N4A76_04705 [Firmicutes bacterium]|jgi:CRISPR-associated endoribonuclease Cas6|nr:hypothetical protein [Bacillota bacterium]